MKTIKIFLASSDELRDDLDAFGNLVRRLDRIYEKRGIRIELFEGEDYGATYNNRRKQYEYNDQIKASDMFLALFHTKAGKFTIEEFDVATEEFRKHASPKVYTYCKDLAEGEQESPELAEFKRKLFEEMGHYWSRYNNRDSMQLHFVMQLQLVETSGMAENLKLEEGVVMLEDMTIAKIDNLQFASGNIPYQKIHAELAELPQKIEKARQRVEKFPDDQDLLDDLQKKMNRYNSLKDELSQLQNSLFETAKRIAEMQLGQVSDMLRRAIEAFEEGNLERANTLLDEIAHEAEHHMAQLEQQRDLVHQDIEAFMLQAKTVMADATIPIDNRIDKTASIYTKAEDWAIKSALPENKLETLLNNYGRFLSKYAKYDKALTVYQNLVCIRERLHGPEHHTTAKTYNSIGNIYNSLGDYENALKFYFKALAIQEKNIDKNHKSTATTYNNIGLVYSNQCDYDKALEFYFRALDMRKNAYSHEHRVLSSSYNNIGLVYCNREEFDKALEYYNKALSVEENASSLDDPNTAITYINIGYVHYSLGDQQKALEFYFKADTILKKTLGLEHSLTAELYNNFGAVYDDLEDYEKALEYYYKALAILEKVFKPNHPRFANLYNNIGSVYSNRGDEEKALEYYYKALETCKKALGQEHPHTAITYNNIGNIYEEQGNYDSALDCYLKTLDIFKKKFGKKHPETLALFKAISNVYMNKSDIFNAIDYLSKANECFSLDDDTDNK